MKRLPAVLIGLAIAVVIAAALLLKPGALEPAAVVRLLGRFHILALHVPIGILVLTLMAEGATLHPKLRERGDGVVVFSLPLLLLTAFAAIMLGLMLAHSGDYPTKVVVRHRNLAIIGFSLAGITTVALPARERAGRMVHRALLGAAALALSVGAHFGGTLTHGSDYLFPAATVKTPDDKSESSDAGAAVDVPAAADAGAATADLPDAAAVAADAGLDAGKPDAGPAKASPKVAAQAVLLRRCAPCHTTKSSGGLRLTDLSHLKAGTVVPGQPAASRMIQRMVLPKDDDDHMPPSEKPQPSAGEINIVRAWITDLKSQ